MVKTLESPLDCKESNLSVLKKISPEYSLEGLTVKLKLQYFGHLVWRADHWKRCGERWKAKEKGMAEEEIVEQHHWLIGHEFEQTLGDSEGQGAWRAAVHGVAKSWTQLSDWTSSLQNALIKQQKLLILLILTLMHTSLFYPGPCV